MDFSDIEFLLSVHNLKQLPEEDFPEIAFAGRSNVGKSSLLNTLLARKKMVKISARPGKTQGLNFFQIGDDVRFVDLPGYGYAKVPQGMQNAWQALITSYLEERKCLKCVVVIVDIRHEPKLLDSQLIDWLRDQKIPFLVVYTKIDKVSGSALGKNARQLDIGHHLQENQRVLFSALNGRGRDKLIEALTTFLDKGPL
ncbi:YihA family ribosome biogenesis GTP-binding protein [Desulforhopalus vacuolatus]|uniref:ribosome biogenesis GTP-binding protein YihA/YsxC n=1 Tax=Desulforhopalus vacuolatus TaxID=40414 RepID=UPI001963129A|nr:ribosome biogenesis GTP-binding protein YihA/YsxC [Desulforhopalus vacuolatus]MBM9519847.1 YihA family ribosome biogenesis GTP-binding protein [Desulforhopalus vacuolatus]